MKIINQPRNKTRYDNNLTIMKSPKPATDNRFKWTLCIVTNWWPFWKWRPVEICWCQESIQDIIIYLHMKCRWNWTMLNFWGIVVAILKMATGRNFSRSGINSGHHYLPTYQILMISENVEFLPSIFYAAFWQPSRNFENAYLLL
jgi:hypothetical protein